MSLSRRQLFQPASATAALSVAGQVAGTFLALAALLWARSDIGVPAYAFGLGQVRLISGRLGGTSEGAQVVLADDNGANTNLWRFL